MHVSGSNRWYCNRSASEDSSSSVLMTLQVLQNLMLNRPPSNCCQHLVLNVTAHLCPVADRSCDTVMEPIDSN
jgi:uncharacterized Zn-finger protein